MSSLLVLIGVYRLEMHSVMLAFSIQLCELLPLKPSFWFTSPTPPPLSKVKVQYIQTMCGCGGMGGGCEVVLETIFCKI